MLTIQNLSNKIKIGNVYNNVKTAVVKMIKGETYMSRKSELKRAIADSEQEIEALEKKRMRSQSSLMEAHVNNVAPNASDVEYFKIYSNLIDLERKNLRQLKQELDKLN